MLQNIVENSIKYMGEQPQPKIEIGYYRKGSETVFFVKDNGIGIPKEEQEKVFQAFYKIDRAAAGTGGSRNREKDCGSAWRTHLG